MRNIQWCLALVFLVGICPHNTLYAAGKTASVSHDNAMHRTKKTQKKNKKKLITKLAILAGSLCVVGGVWVWLQEQAKTQCEVVPEQKNYVTTIEKIEHKAERKSEELSKDGVQKDARSHYVFTLTELGAEVQKKTDLPVDCISIIGDYLQWDEFTQQSLPSIKYVQLGVRDGKPIVLIHGYDGRIAVLDGCTGTSLCDFQGHRWENFLTSLSPNGEQFCAYKGKIFYALDTKTGQEQRRFEERKSLLEKVQGLVSSNELYTGLAHMIFSPKTGEKIVTYMAYKTIVWDAETNKSVYESSPNIPWRSPKTYFDDDGTKLLLNCGEGALDVVDLKSLQPTRIEVLKNNVDILTGAVLTSSGDKVVASVDVRRLEDAHYHYVFDSTTGASLASIAHQGIGAISKALSNTQGTILVLQTHSGKNPYYNVQVYDLEKKTVCYDTHGGANNAEHDIVPCIQMDTQRTRCLLAGVARRYRVVSMVDGKMIYTAPEHKGFQGKSVEYITKLPQYSVREGEIMEPYKRMMEQHERMMEQHERIVGKDFWLKRSLARIVAYWTPGDQGIVTIDWTDENEIYDAHKHTLIGRLDYALCDTIMFAQDASHPDVSWALTKEQNVDDIGVSRLLNLVQKGSQAPTALAQS